MPATMQRRRARASTALLLVLILGGLVALPSTAEETPLPVGANGSWFEILDGNTVVDYGDGYLDWDNVDAVVKEDQPSGQNDDSFGNGTKEDTAVPSIVTGSIPPNKSDLKEFGYYLEDVPGEPGFLHLFWTRVQDPSGTTNMDFEFNDKACTTDDQSGCSANGVTPIRTIGDLLITYDLSRGGTQATISLRTWEGSAWGPAQNLNPDVAVGSINTETINTNINDVPGTYSPRTFGEATINLDAVFDPTVCQSFGGAYLKSRASDSFNSALKDFIAPIGVDLANCGRVVVEKVDEVGEPLAGAEFTINPPNAAATPVSDLTEVADGVFCIDDLLLSTEYTITESVVPDGYDGAPHQTFTPTEIGSCGFANGLPEADLTFVNTRQTGTITIEKKVEWLDSTRTTDETFEFQADAPLGNFSLADGGSKTELDVVVGTYNVKETDPAPDFLLTGISCTDEDALEGASTTSLETGTATINLNPGETVTCTFTNTEQPTSILIVKTTENENELLADAEFELTKLGEVTLTEPIPLIENPDGVHCADDLARDGMYTVSETPPTGYEDVADFPVTATDFATCAERLAALGENPVASDYSSAADHVQKNVPLAVDLTVNKWKLSFADGEFVETDIPLDGFDFTLYEGQDDTGTAVDTLTTVAGSATFADLTVGTEYTVCETGVPTGQDGYWSDGGCETFTPELNTDEEFDFYNSPRADVSIEFSDVTGYTSATIECTSGDDVVESEAFTTNGTLDLDKLDLGDYDCTIEVRNGTTS
jgi:hypothetical protein